MFYDLSVLLVGFVHLHSACFSDQTYCTRLSHKSCEDLFNLDIHIHLLQKLMNQEITCYIVHPLASLIQLKNLPRATGLSSNGICNLRHIEIQTPLPLYTISVGVFVGPLLERIVAAVLYSPNMIRVILTVSIVRETLNCERRQRVLWHS